MSSSFGPTPSRLESSVLLSRSPRAEGIQGGVRELVKGQGQHQPNPGTTARYRLQLEGFNWRRTSTLIFLPPPAVTLRGRTDAPEACPGIVSAARHALGDRGGRLMAATPSMRFAVRAMIRATSTGSLMTNVGVRRSSSAILQRMVRASAGKGSGRGFGVTLQWHLQLPGGARSPNFDTHLASLPAEDDPRTGQGGSKHSLSLSVVRGGRPQPRRRGGQID